MSVPDTIAPQQQALTSATAKRAPRKRDNTAKSGLSSDEYAPVLIVRDRHGETTDQVLPDLEGATFVGILKPVVAQDALLVSDGRAAYAMFADHSGLLHIALNASKGERNYSSYHIQNVNGYISRLKHWLHRFKGVATHYLAKLSGMAANDRAKLKPDACRRSSKPCLTPQLESRTEPRPISVSVRSLERFPPDLVQTP